MTKDVSEERLREILAAIAPERLQGDQRLYGNNSIGLSPFKADTLRKALTELLALRNLKEQPVGWAWEMRTSYKIAKDGRVYNWEPHLTTWKPGDHKDDVRNVRPVYASPSSPVSRNEVIEAARDLIASRFSTYRARNNRQVSIQDDSGEKCWIVPFDAMHALELALSPTDKGEATHRHVKRGSEYVLIGYGRMQAESWLSRAEVVPDRTGVPPRPVLERESADMREVAIYRSIDDGSLWVRPREEFEDGRFIALSPEVGNDK